MRVLGCVVFYLALGCVAMCLCTTAQCQTHDLTIETFHASSELVEFYRSASSTGRVVLGGDNGLVTFLGSSPELDSSVRIPTVTTITAIESLPLGIIALNGNHQLFRDDGNGEWKTVYSRNSRSTVHLATRAYCVSTVDSFAIHRSENDDVIYNSGIDDRRVTCLTTPDTYTICVGFSDGSLEVLTNSGSLVLADSIGRDSLSFVTVDGKGQILATTSDSTFVYNSEDKTWSHYIPELILSEVQFGTNHSISILREYERGDTMFTAVNVIFDGKGKLYTSLLSRANHEGYKDWKLLYHQFDYYLGPLASVVSGDSTIVVSSSLGLYSHYKRTGRLGVIELARDNDERHERRHGHIAASANGDVLMTYSRYKGGYRELPPSINIVYRLDTDNQLSEEKLPEGDYPKEAVLKFIIENDDHSVVLFNKPDTTLQYSNANRTYQTIATTSSHRIVRSGSNLLTFNGGNVRFSTDGGLSFSLADVGDGFYRDINILEDGTMIATYSNEIDSTYLWISKTSGASWQSVSVPGIYHTICGAKSDTVYLLNYQRIGLDSSLHVKVASLELSSSHYHIVVDTTFSWRGYPISGAILNNTLHVLCAGDVGLVSFDENFALTRIDTTDFRVGWGSLRPSKHVSKNRAVFRDDRGPLITITDRGVTSVHDNLQRVHVSKIWPMPATNSMRFSVLIPFNEDVHQTTAGIYDVTGRQMMDLTPLLRSGTRTDGTMEFETPLNELQSGAYLFVAKVRGRAVSKNIIVSR